MKFKVGTLVKILRVPEGQLKWNGRHVGHVGLVEVFVHDGARALVQIIKPPGERDGAMFLPTEFLEPVNDPVWDEVLAGYRRLFEREGEDIAEWRRKRREQIKTVAEKYQMSVEKMMEILDDVLGYDAQYYY